MLNMVLERNTVSVIRLSLFLFAILIRGLWKFHFYVLNVSIRANISTATYHIDGTLSKAESPS